VTVTPLHLCQQPFVLLDDARAGGAAPARLFVAPKEIVVAHSPAEVDALLTTLDGWQRAGGWAAGFLTYEAGMAFEQRTTALARQLAEGWPLAWFGRFDTAERIAAPLVPGLLPDPAGGMLGSVHPDISEAAYHSAVRRILSAITAGDIYQANLTFQASVAVHGHPLALYARLRQTAQAGYGGLVWTGTHWLLSCSPELFLSIKQGRLMARPMKGTAARMTVPEADRMAAAALASDPKQRAENLMIVDLIRNDLSRIAVPGSVEVPSLFRVETYPTVHQMVSDVRATIRPNTPISAVLRAAFPCGSITGAPKLQAMATIAAVETAARGPYTGSIGFVGPDGEAAFNVAIRTLTLPDGAACATLGLGSGIVADSDPAAEWRECLAKGGFVDQATNIDFDLIETMAFDPETGLPLLDRHLARLGESARTLGFHFDRHELRNRLQHATFRQDCPARVRVRLSWRGAIAIEVGPMPAAPDGQVAVAIAPLPVPRSDIRLAHKTSARSFYDDARRASGAWEVVFTDSDGLLTEGSFTNIFVERRGMLLTPPTSRAPLPGVLRAQLLAEGRACEAELTPADLANGFLLGNSVRGLIPAMVAK
jgi:para-aminobenzoate synthetase/4-amino-4-deoxychorismate lyase